MISSSVKNRIPTAFAVSLLFTSNLMAYPPESIVPVRAEEACRLLLDTPSVPIVDVFVSLGRNFDPYDRANSVYDWSLLCGRPISVQYHEDAKPSLEVRQNILSNEELTERYPAIALLVKNMVLKHNEALRIFLANWKWKLTSGILTFVGNGKSIETTNRSAPGELGQLFLQLEDQSLSSKLLSGLIQGETKGGNPADKFHQLSVDKSFQQLRVELPELVAKTILSSTAKPDSLEATLFFIHTHPGGPIPLSPEDVAYLDQAAVVLAKEFPYIRFRLVMVALAGVKAMGDIAFTQERVIERTAKLTELLQKLRGE